MRARLPHREERAHRVGEHRHAPDVEDVHRREDHLSAGRGDLLGRGVGALDGDVRGPHRRAGVLGLADAGDRTVTDHGHAVPTGLRRALRGVPAEQRAVEVGGALGVGTPEIDPGRDSGLVRVDLHGAAPVGGRSRRDATLRRVQSFPVLRDFAPDDVDRIRALADDVEAVTGVVPLGDDAWTGMHAARGRDRGLIDPSGDAYAHLAHHHAGEWSIELAVRPGTPDRRDDLLAAALVLVAEGDGGHVTYWVHDADPDGHGADDTRARAAGFTLERELLQMRVALPLADPPRWPDDVTVRAFVPGQDEAAWVEVNNRAFAGHPEQGAWTVDMLRAREQEPWFDPEGFLLAFDADGLAGSCWTKVHPPQPPREPDALGEIYVIGADPSRHGRGLGRALTAEGLASLAARGIRVGMLFVDAANDAAVGLYRSLGFTTARTDRAYGLDVA